MDGPGRHLRPVLAGLLLAVLLLGVVVPIAAAHANLVESSPGQGERVAEAPSEVTLRYTEGVQVATVSVVAADGERVNTGLRVDDADPTVVHVPVEPLSEGTYVVTWQVLSVDGHTTTGSFLFTVGDEAPTRAQLIAAYGGSADGAETGADADERGGVGPIAGTGPFEPAVRTLLLGGMVVLVGVPPTLALVVLPLARTRDLDTGTTVGRSKILIGAGVAAVVVATAALALVQVRAAGPTTPAALRSFAGTDLGVAFLVQLAAALGVGALAVLHDRTGVVSTTRWLAGAALGGLAVSAGIARTSHSAAMIGGLAGWLADLGHLVGAALWLGGLLALALLVPPLLDRSGADAGVAADLLRRYSALALAGVTLAGATGLVIAAWHVPSVDALASTAYGTALSAKVAVVALAVGLGAFNRFVHLRRLRAAATPDARGGATVPGLAVLPVPGRGSGDPVPAFLASVRVEVGVLVLVLLLSGVLTSVPTAADALDHDDHGTTGTVLAAETDHGTVELALLPGRTGPNVLDVRLDANGTPVRPDQPVTVQLRHDERDVTLPQVELRSVEPGLYSTVTTIPAAGTWEVRVNTWVDGRYVSERFAIEFRSPAADTADPAGPESDGLPVFLRFAALGVAVVGSVALAVELLARRRS